MSTSLLVCTTILDSDSALCDSALCDEERIGVSTVVFLRHRKLDQIHICSHPIFFYFQNRDFLTHQKNAERTYILFTCGSPSCSLTAAVAMSSISLHSFKTGRSDVISVGTCSE